MSLTPFDDNVPNISYEEAEKAKKELAWQKAKKISIDSAIQEWISTLSGNTLKSYESSIRSLIRKNLIRPEMSIQEFALSNLNRIVDQIKLVEEWSEATKQAKAACFISFTRFLDRRTDSFIKRALPSREGVNKTFFKVREKVKTNTMKRPQWLKMIAELEKMNKRDALIAKLMIQGAKRVSEVLSLKTENICWDTNTIIFVQSKTKGFYKESVITYSDSILDEIRPFMGKHSTYVFVTRNGKKIQRDYVYRQFVKAGKRAEIPIKTTPHTLRASAITYLKGQGYSDSDIMKVSGHASAEMVNSYDKTEMSKNPSSEICLI